MTEFDWQGAYARLEHARRALEAGGERPPEEANRILRERARALAVPAKQAEAPTDILSLLVFSLAGSRYAVETAYVQEVIPLRGVTPVPCTPSFILGVMNHRGRILPLLDLGRVFGLTGEGVAEGGRGIVVEARGMTFGIFADAVAGTVTVQVQELLPPPAGLAGDRHGFLRGVTGAMVAVIDLPTLIRDPRVVVNEQ